MTVLHAHFHHRKYHAFCQRLKGATVDPAVDVNARDWLGRTVLHLACSSLDGLEYIKALVRFPSLNVNIQDEESRYTPLHRALYYGNLASALLLLDLKEIDISLKDSEGYTAFDLFNSTVEGTGPGDVGPGAQLFTWGANRNSTLGVGDADNRAYPERVSIHHKPNRLRPIITQRFNPPLVRQVSLSRLHSVVITDENEDNLQVCGFGSGGRLGHQDHTQYTFKRLHQPISERVTSAACGQDHTLALTENGNVYTWGMNRFYQLGYPTEGPTKVTEEHVQLSPRKVTGALKKLTVIGIAASRSASACWTESEIYTWGTNYGQLGYDIVSSFQPVPRRVTKVMKSVLSISLSDSAMVCLLTTQDVICVWANQSMRINFPPNGFPSEIQPYRPPHAVKGTCIARVTNQGNDTFVALSSNGDVFTFNIPGTSDVVAFKSLKPHRVQALKHTFSSVKDVAITADGSIAICTESGHVFLRSRSTATTVNEGHGPMQSITRSSRFHRVAYLQRVIKIEANNTGGFAALRENFVLPPINPCAQPLVQDLSRIRPYLDLAHIGGFFTKYQTIDETEDDHIDCAIVQDIIEFQQLCASLTHPCSRKHGSDITVAVGNVRLPAHNIVLASRSRTLSHLLSGKQVPKHSKIHLRIGADSPRLQTLYVHGCHPLAVLVVLHYLYTDSVIAINDRRVTTSTHDLLTHHRINPQTLVAEIRLLATILLLPEIDTALSTMTKTQLSPTISKDFTTLFDITHSGPQGILSAYDPNVIIELQDNHVYCHSTILRARSSYFADLFDHWSTNRWSNSGKIIVNLRHLQWNIFQYVLRFVCCGHGTEIFDSLDETLSLDEVLEFVFDIVAVASELLIDDLAHLCASVINNYISTNTVCYILSEASHYNVSSLVDACHLYIAVNLETLLESKIIGVLPTHLVEPLSKFIRYKQAEKMPVVRSQKLLNQAMEANVEWIALQDFSEPIASTAQRHPTRVSSGKTPIPSSRPSVPRSATLSHSPSFNEIFSMDEQVIEAPALAAKKPIESTKSTPWKHSFTPRVDLRSVLAESAKETPGSPKGLPIGKMAYTQGSPETRPLAQTSVAGTPPGGALRKESSLASSPPAIKPSSMSSSSTTAAMMGPVISPQKQQRKGSSNNLARAWKASSSANESQESTAGLSFLEIQNQQKQTPLASERHSLLKIQEEEEARQREEEFLKWWAEEAEKTQSEMRLSGNLPGDQSGSPRRGGRRGPRKGDTRGRGGGHRE